jgi:3-phenylpropionate/trans-cinnamate dioxygenase ferredoxin component
VTEWINIGRNEEFTVGLHEVRVGDHRLVLAVLEGELFAFAPFCPHASGPLHMSEVSGTIVSCPLHGWRFDLRDSGKEIHGYRPLTMYEVKVDHGSISVAMGRSEPAVSAA